jgi:hypothetical protein
VTGSIFDDVAPEAIEQWFVGGTIRSRAFAELAASRVPPDDIYSPGLRLAYEVAIDMSERDTMIRPGLVDDALEAAGFTPPWRSNDFCNLCPVWADMDGSLAAIVRVNARERRAKAALSAAVTEIRHGASAADVLTQLAAAALRGDHGHLLAAAAEPRALTPGEAA